MATSDWLHQEPQPGSKLLRFSGDTVTFTLTLNRPGSGTGWLRTNIGYADISRREIIRAVHHQETPLGRDWFDLPMVQVDDRQFQATLPLVEVGHFEAKCFFIDPAHPVPQWPAGTNTTINVEPADTCCANIIYNAFVRQFGPNKSGRFQPPISPDQIHSLDRSGYSVIPPSGKFRDLIQELDFIVGGLGCRWIQLLPIHPTPTTYGRMGRFGSPYAALSFTEVDPALAEFDPAATPLEQFIELVDAIHARHAKIIIDIAINHTGWAAGLHESHPHWLARNPKGQIEVPGAWGVRWEDLAKLDYAHRDLWRYMANVFLTWCRRGVDGFRCDAGYMIPLETWQYIIARVRDAFPDTIFLLEGLGGKISVTRDLLDLANFNWAYSELFQNYDQTQIETYLPEPTIIAQTEGGMVHFAETHDNPRLAARSKRYAFMRTAMCALFAPHGAFAFANGVEWLADEKIDVHGSPSLNWGAEPNLVAHLQRLHTVLREHPAFGDRTDIRMVHAGRGNYVVLRRRHRPSGRMVWVVVNLDDRSGCEAAWHIDSSDPAGTQFTDLLEGTMVSVARSDSRMSLALEPGQVLCLAADDHQEQISTLPPDHFLLPPARVLEQRLREKVLEVYAAANGIGNMAGFDIEQAVREIQKNPLEFCRQMNPHGRESRVVTWRWPRDIRRRVMIPPDHFLLVRSNTPFRACIDINHQTTGWQPSLPTAAGSYFVLFSPKSRHGNRQKATLKIRMAAADKTQHADAPLLWLTDPENLKVRRTIRSHEVKDRSLLLLGTNGRGGMMRALIAPGQLNSRYDALLAANLHPEHPEDRRIMLTRCRAWLVCQGYSQEINTSCLVSFTNETVGRGCWHYRIPTGQGQSVRLSVVLEMTAALNQVGMTYFRHPAGDDDSLLDDRLPVQLIVRPDIEDRSFHETTKAFLGPEKQWPNAVRAVSNGFVFAPHPHRQLQMLAEYGRFEPEPEWYYMVHRPLEAERGLDPDSDLFSPGYFSTDLEGGRQLVITATVDGPDNAKKQGAFAASTVAPTVPDLQDTLSPLRPLNALRETLNQFVVQRGEHKSVIAGYPWFLDWGRDSLIATRGLIAAGRTDAARQTLIQFGQFEQTGTIPNMIRGNDVGNRNTSDAPLWFVIACRDLVQAEGRTDFLDVACGGRTIGEVLHSIATSLVSGAPNGVCMDAESALLFSPAHFTWMDTKHPTGTPREGYPVEIQALWYAALRFLARSDLPDTGPPWDQLAQQVQDSMGKLYFLKESGYFADCLHGPPGTPANRARPDDALRPNQLFTITLDVLTDRRIGQAVLAACEQLLIPGAVRSLADRPVRYPLPIVFEGRSLNDPDRPYWGRYRGDEDTRRKPAYHNGTAWSWLLPTYCEAWFRVYGESGKKAALAMLGSMVALMNRGCLGHLPEILDGDEPHHPRGCDAQAWGASELLRVWTLLDQ